MTHHMTQQEHISLLYDTKFGAAISFFIFLRCYFTTTSNKKMYMPSNAKQDMGLSSAVLCQREARSKCELATEYFLMGSCNILVRLFLW